jgi:glycosyltransferase involved in cell wall biosynthesis
VSPIVAAASRAGTITVAATGVWTPDAATGGIIAAAPSAVSKPRPASVPGVSAQPPDVSVVVTTRNRAAQLGELLGGLRVQTHPAGRFEVIVVDDGSTDGTAELLAREARRGGLELRTVSRTESGGAAIGREAGWRQARAELVAFTDDDCVPDAGWLAAGLRACEENPGAIVQGLTEPRPDQLDRGGPFTRTIDAPRLDHAFQTTNIFYPRELLERAGGFDTETFAGAVGGEDTDLAWRAIGLGAQPVFCADARVMHAVNRLGAVGVLRVAARWTAVVPYARYPEMREADFVAGLFRKETHLKLLIALAGLALGRRSKVLGLLLCLPYLRTLRGRAVADGASVRGAAFYALHDLVETFATVRGGIRSGRLMI